MKVQPSQKRSVLMVMQNDGLDVNNCGEGQLVAIAR